MRGNDIATEIDRVAVSRSSTARAWQGTALAFVGVATFSGSFPATALALRGFDPYLVALGRASIAFVIAAACLLAVGAPLLPPRAEWRSYGLIVLGVVLGFPLFGSLALDLGASSAHAAVVTGLLPAATAAVAVARAGERPRVSFWAAAAAGAVAVTVFTLSQGGGHFTLSDLLLVGGLVSAGIGYAEGGRLTRNRPGWQVISHALVLAAPVTVPATVVLALVTEVRPAPDALAGLAYAGVVSSFLGFIPWYAGLARGGIARAGQTQLLQPLLTLVWSWLLVGEHVGPVTVLGAVAVLGCVALTQRLR